MIDKKNIAVFMIFLMLTSTVVGLIANAEIIKENQKEYEPLLFDAEITFYILTGEGCGCDPIEGVLVSAYGGAGNESEVTDEDGKCVLTLEINSEYEIYIEKENFININFEMDIIDDQTFTFHLLERKGRPKTANLNVFQIIEHILLLLKN